MHTCTLCIINQIWVIYYKINRKILDSQQSQEHCLENFPNLIYDASLQCSKPHPCRHCSLLTGRDFSPLSRNKETTFSVILYHIATSVHSVRNLFSVKLALTVFSDISLLKEVHYVRIFAITNLCTDV